MNTVANPNEKTQTAVTSTAAPTAGEAIDPAEWLNNDPSVVSGFTDSGLLEYLNTRGLTTGAEDALAAEVWLRRWLYAGRCPPPIMAAIAFAQGASRPGFSITFAKRIEDELQRPLRDNDDGRTLSDGEGLDGQEERIWGLVVARVGAFLEADGLMALIPDGGHADDDGVAVPFRFVAGGSGRCLDAKSQPLKAGEWVKVLEALGDQGPLAGGQTIRVEAVFPSETPPGGGSIGLAVALAWERRQARDLPLFAPLAVLATGGLNSGQVSAVDGSGGQSRADTRGGAKGQLACRLGVKLYLAVDVDPKFATGSGITVCSFPSRTKWEQVRSRSAQAVKELKLTDAPRHLQRIEQEESRPAPGEDLPAAELWSRWRRLGRVRNSFAAIDQRCVKAKTGQQRIEVALGFHNVSVIASASDQVVSDYRQRRFVGRSDERAQLDRFLAASPGGTMVVLGPPGYGKSALMAQLVNHLPSNRATLVHFFRQDRQSTRDVVGFMRRLWHFLLSEIGDGEGAAGQMSLEELIGRVDVSWQDWKELPARLRRPLVIVIDGLDEAKDTFEPPWPSGLPDQVHVIATCRTGTNCEPPPYLKTWLTKSARIHLGGLKVKDLVDWLSDLFGDLNESERAKLPDLQKLAEEIEQRTHGCTLFAQYLMGDLRRGIDNNQSWETILASTPPAFADYLRQQYLDFDGPGANRARQLIALLVAAYGPLCLGEIQRILPDVEPGYAFADRPWQAYRWITSEVGPAGWGEQFSLTHEMLREVLAGVVPKINAQERLLAFCQDWKQHLSPYAVRYVPKYNAECFSPPHTGQMASNIVVSTTLPASSTPEFAVPRKEAGPVSAELRADRSNATRTMGERVLSAAKQLPDPVPELADSDKRPVVSLMGLEALSRDAVFVEASSVEAPEEPAPVLDAVRRALEQAVQDPNADYRKVTELALTHAKLLHQLAQQDDFSVEHGRTELETAEHFLKLPVQWDPAAQVMWRLLAAWEHHRGKRNAERNRHLTVLGSIYDVRLPGAWRFLAGALLVEVLPAYDARLHALAVRFLGVEAMAEMVGRLTGQGDLGVRTARQWLERGSRYEIAAMRRHVVYSLAKTGRWREAEWEARGAFTVKEQANLLLQLSELAENDLDRNKDLWKWADYLETYVRNAALPPADFLRVNSVLGRITAILARQELLFGRSDVRELVERAESFVQEKRFSRGSGKFDVQAGLAFAFAASAAKRTRKQSQLQFQDLARHHRRKAFRAWLRLRAASGDTLEVFQIWLWFAHLTFGLVCQGALPSRIGKWWESRLRRILVPTDEAGDARIHALLNACELEFTSTANQSQASSLSLRYLEPVEWDAAMVAAVEAVLEAPSFGHEEVLQVISRSRSAEARAKGMARWIKKLVEAGEQDVVEASLAKSQLRPEDEAAAHSLLARRLLSSRNYESASRHVAASIRCGTEKVEGWESFQRVELLATLSRAAGAEGGAFFEEAVELVNGFPNSKPVEKALLCSSLAQTAIFHRRRQSVTSASRRTPGKYGRFDKCAWTDEANYWFSEISKLQECPGTGYQRRARKVVILCAEAKHLFQLDWNLKDQREALVDAQIAARNEPSLQRRCELMCEVAEAYVACGDALGANQLFADIQAELPVLPTTNPDGYLWRKRGIKPRMLRGPCLAELVLGLGKVAIQSWRVPRLIKHPKEAKQLWSEWKAGRSLSAKHCARIEDIITALQRGELNAALSAASQISGDPATATELRPAVFRQLTSQISWSAWALTYINDSELQSHQSALRGWALASAANNEWSQVWTLVRRISDPTICTDTFLDLAEFSARVGAVYDVRQRARNLMSTQDKDRVLHRVVAALVERYRAERNWDERAAIKQVLMELVPPCAESFGATYLMLAGLVEIDSRNWRTVAEALRSRRLINTSIPVDVQ